MKEQTENPAGLAGTLSLGGELEVRRLGFGAMRITGDGIWGPPKNPDSALRVLRRAVELGVNFIDTADSYGPYVSEELIAKALAPYPPDLVIATKGGWNRPGPNQWRAQNVPPPFAARARSRPRQAPRAHAADGGSSRPPQRIRRRSPLRWQQPRPRPAAGQDSSRPSLAPPFTGLSPGATSPAVEMPCPRCRLPLPASGRRTHCWPSWKVSDYADTSPSANERSAPSNSVLIHADAA